MDRLDMIGIVQKIRQIVSDPHNRSFIISRYRVHKCLLRMGVVNKNLRPVVLFCKLHIFGKQCLRVQFFRARHRRTVNRIEVTRQILVVFEFLPVYSSFDLRFVGHFRGTFLILLNEFPVLIYFVLILRFLFRSIS